MPCDIGYRNTTKIKAAPKLPQEFKGKVKPPALDKSFLDNLGIEDVVFLDWVLGLDINPLLAEALKRTVAALGGTDKVEFLINGGELEIKAKYMNSREKREIESLARKVSERFQMETIGIIAELLDYVVVFSEKISGGNKVLIVEGEKNESASVHKYLKVSIGANGDGVLVFEHFESQPSLKQEQAKFVALARKFGIKLRLSEERELGQPIPQNMEHQNFLRQGE